MPNVTRTTTSTALLCAALAVFIAAGLARADSIGGSINNNEKTLSGTVRESAPEADRPAGRQRPSTRRSSPERAIRSEGGVTRFDGPWSAIFPAGCGGAGTVAVTVSGGKVGGLGFSGTLSASGDFHVGTADGSVCTGRMTGSTGYATYREANGCTRRIRLIKN
jgi:hypothetical protein